VDLSQIFDEVVQGIEDGLYSIINHPSLVLLNILAFIVLMFFVKKFLWEKVTRFIDLRQQALMEAMETADQERARAQELQAKSTKDYEQMKEETRQLKEKLTQDAYRQQEELILSAKKEAQRRLEQTELDIQFEIAQANEEIKQSIKEIAFLAAEKIVKREIDESVHQDIIDSILEENGQS
jgi:F-type H+-transporting ATPase subunit b